jgi:hypothetical protein
VHSGRFEPPAHGLGTCWSIGVAVALTCKNALAL